MSRDLPYFKFFTSEWLNGDITIEDYELQGLFINVCAYYWHKDCVVSFTQLQKKFRHDRLVILTENFMTIDADGYVHINFLDEQFTEFAVRKEKLSNAGKKGAAIKAQQKEVTTLEPPLNHPSTIREDKEKIKEEKIKEDISTNVEHVKIDFEALLKLYNSIFNKKCVVIPEQAKRSFKARLKEGYSKQNIVDAMHNVKVDEFHTEQDYKYATISYFSRSKTLDMFGTKNNKQTKYVPR